MRCDLKKLAILILLPLALLSGCKKKKPAIPPPQAQPPVITQPQPQQQPPVQPPVQQPPAQRPPVTTEPSQPPVTAKPKPKTHKRHVAKKPPEQKNKTVVKEGGEAPAAGQLSAGIPQDEATHQRQTTAQLRQSTENNLRGVTRPLSSDEQAMVQQIRAFLSQSRAADADGDTERAYNLAVKAHLLADELMKH